MKTFSFEKLKVWQEARQLTVKVYKITKDFPIEERFGLMSQMRRCSISVSSNIAEGTSRKSNRDQIRFYEIAFGSLMELLNQSILCVDLLFIQESELIEIRQKVSDIAYKLTMLKNSKNQT